MIAIDIQFRLIPFRRHREHDGAYTYDPETGTALTRDGVKYHVQELIAIARNDIPASDLKAIHTLKKVFKGELMYIKCKKPIDEPAVLRKRYERWMYEACKCTGSKFVMQWVPRASLYLVSCAKCGRSAGSMSRTMGDMVTALNDKFRKQALIKEGELK